MRVSDRNMVPYIRGVTAIILVSEDTSIFRKYIFNAVKTHEAVSTITVR